MGWSPDLESGGRRFDSRLAQGRFGVFCFINFGMSWDVSGSGLGTFSDGFGSVCKKCPARSGNVFLMTGSIFAELGCSKIAFLANPCQKTLTF